MRFKYTIIYVADVERSVAFYEDAFGLERRFVHESGQYAEMETGDTALAFASNELADGNFPDDFRRNEPGEPPAGIEVAFLADDVPAAFKAATDAGAAATAEPRPSPGGRPSPTCATPTVCSWRSATRWSASSPRPVSPPSRL